MTSRKSKPDDIKRRENSIASWDYSCYVLLLVPIILFLGSLYIPPTIVSDSGVGFLALRSMLEGGAFNSITAPDPANIANDVAIFLTWWSPGQYLVPGSFIWLGTSYGLAVSLTTLIATLIGVVGWIQVARSFAVSSFVLFVFVLGLNTFPYVTHRFLMYWGGELLLFAAAPWSLYAMRWAANKPPILCFTISLLSAALLFFAKLTGLVVFATNVVAISLVALVSQRRLDSSTIAMWVASAIAALCFMMFWVARGPVAADGRRFPLVGFRSGFRWLAAAFSGIYGLALFLAHPWMQINYPMGDRIARTTRAAAHGMGVVSTSSHALPGHGRSVVNHHLDVRDYSRHYISVSSRSHLVRGPSFPLRWNTILSSAADGRRSVARTLGQGSRMRWWSLCSGFTV